MKNMQSEKSETHQISNGDSEDCHPIYQRILLKLSGEALLGNSHYGLDPIVLDRLATEIHSIHQLGTEVAVVVGGGNYMRGTVLSHLGIGRVTADHMGMLATIINCLAFKDALDRANVHTRIMSAIPMSGMVDHYDRRKAIYHLQQKRVLLFAAGTGNPLVTTDSAASLRAIEIEADVLLKGTNVDGIYDKDPQKYPDATIYRRLSYQKVLQLELGVMDLGAFCQCRDYNMPIRVFNIGKEGALRRLMLGHEEGTFVSGDEK